MFYKQWKENTIIILFLSLTAVLKIVKLAILWKCPLYKLAMNLPYIKYIYSIYIKGNRENGMVKCIKN